MNLILLAGVLTFCGQVKAQTISITECYEWARENYPQIHQHGLIDQTERYNLSNAGKAWLPQVSVNAKASYQSEVTKLPFDGKQISSMLPGAEIPVLSKDQYQVVAQVDQAIWDGGSARSNRALTRAEATANREQLESELYVVNNRVNQLYFGCLLQDELLRQNAILQKDLQTNIERIQSMMENGVANQSDLESMEVELLNVQQKAIELKASRKAFRQMLSAFIAQPLTESTVLKTPDSPETISTQINRPELRALDARSAFLETQHKQLTAGLMPRLSAFVQGGFGRPGLNMLENGFEPFYIAGVRLSWNVGRLYTLKNDRRKIEVNRRTVDVQRETFLFNTRLQLLQQNTEIKKMTDLMRTDDSIIRLRSSIKNAAEVKLENGVIAVTDLIREINAEDMAKQTAITHRVQRLMSLYNYMYTTN